MSAWKGSHRQVRSSTEILGDDTIDLTVFPPASPADLSNLNSNNKSAPGELEIEFLAFGTEVLVGAEVFGKNDSGIFSFGALNGGSDISLDASALTVVSVSNADDQIEITGHGLTTGQGPVRIVSTITLPAGLVADTDYFVIVIDANEIKLATTKENATASPAVPIDLTTDGSGVITLSVPTRAFRQRINHSPEANLYGIAVTSHTNGERVRVSFRVIQREL